LELSVFLCGSSYLMRSPNRWMRPFKAVSRS